MDIAAVLIEFTGTLIFASVILSSGGQAIPIGLTLTAMILFGGAVSGGHFNPAVSTMMLSSGKLCMGDWLFYIIAQVAGAVCAALCFSPRG